MSGPFAVTRYAMVPGAEGRVQEVYPRHRAFYEDFATGGDLLLIGPLLPAPGSGAMAVFRTRAAAEAFVEGDPFLLEGLATVASIEDWAALRLG